MHPEETGRSDDPVRRYRERTGASRDLYEEARESMPGGGTRNAVYHAPYPAYLTEGEGPRVTDEDGNTYLDFLNNYTTLIHGHADPDVVGPAVERVKRGNALGGPHREQIEWARHLCERAPAVERIRFTNSGTEATMNAIRAARAYTGNDVVAKFEGVYHGTHDDVQVSVGPPTHLAGPARDPESVPESAGLPASTTEEVITLPFNDPDAAERKLERHREDLAGVILCPLMGSKVVPGTDAFIDRLDEWTTEADVPLIFDEVISFRVSEGGAHADYGVEPDLVTFGKIIGGGFAVGAFGGRAAVMSGFDPRGGPEIVHSGTFNANPVTAAAGLAAMEAYTAEEAGRINDLAADIVARSRETFDDHGIAAEITHYGSLFNVYLTDGPVEDYRTAHASHHGLEERLYFELLEEGIRTAPKLMGCTSTAMDEAEADAFVEGLDAALGRLRPAVEAHAPDLVD
jgi:glutamate-1-semialdehyde 2,1-aminomutase